MHILYTLLFGVIVLKLGVIPESYENAFIALVILCTGIFHNVIAQIFSKHGAGFALFFFVVGFGWIPAVIHDAHITYIICSAIAFVVMITHAIEKLFSLVFTLVKLPFAK